MEEKLTDKFIDKLKTKGHIELEGDFKITFDYIKEGSTSNSCIEGMSLTIWPSGRDGSGITLEIDPYDDQICSGIALTAEQNGFFNK